MIRMAFFLTMPISRNSADQRHDGELQLEQQQRQHRADAGRGQRRQHRDRVHQALVQDAQHDVDDDDGRQDQQRLLAGCDSCAARAVPWKLPRTLIGMRDLGLGRPHRGLAVGQRHAVGQVVRDGGGQFRVLVVDRGGGGPLVEARDAPTAAP
jgi:hypothetical protein